jgi:hypothetical protein
MMRDPRTRTFGCPAIVCAAGADWLVLPLIVSDDCAAGPDVRGVTSTAVDRAAALPSSKSRASCSWLMINVPLVPMYIS